MQYLGRQCVRYFNFKHARSGGLFEDRFKSSLVQGEKCLLACLQYIELNPVRAGMVKDPGDYRWSSYAARGFCQKVNLSTLHIIYQSLSDDPAEPVRIYRELIGASLGADTIVEIRPCVNEGLILVAESFREQFTSLTGDAV